MLWQVILPVLTCSLHPQSRLISKKFSEGGNLLVNNYFISSVLKRNRHHRILCSVTLEKVTLLIYFFFLPVATGMGREINPYPEGKVESPFSYDPTPCRPSFSDTGITALHCLIGSDT